MHKVPGCLLSQDLGLIVRLCTLGAIWVCKVFLREYAVRRHVLVSDVHDSSQATRYDNALHLTGLARLHHGHCPVHGCSEVFVILREGEGRGDVGHVLRATNRTLNRLCVHKVSLNDINLVEMLAKPFSEVCHLLFVIDAAHCATHVEPTVFDKLHRDDPCEVACDTRDRHNRFLHLSICG